jgi:hypothetical protein
MSKTLIIFIDSQLYYVRVSTSEVDNSECGILGIEVHSLGACGRRWPMMLAHICEDVDFKFRPRLDLDLERSEILVKVTPSPPP